MRNGNPALKDTTFDQFAQGGVAIADPRAGVMTVEGTVNKTGILLALAAISASVTWSMVYQDAAAAVPLALGGALVGFVISLVTIFKPSASPWSAPIYALLEGLFLGAISAVMNVKYPGIPAQAVGLTFGTLAVMLLAYKTRVVQATDKFRMGVVAATGGIFVFYLLRMVLSLFNVEWARQLGSFSNGSPLAIGISLVVVVIAALNLVLDFDFIEKGARLRAPRYMEWYGAFGLMVTLVWLYLEILRLLSRLNSRR